MAARWRATCSTTSSVTACRARATSRWRSVSGSPRARGAEHLEELGLEWFGHAVTVVAEIIHIDRESPFRLEAHDVAHAIYVGSVAASGQRHDRALLERVEAQMGGDEGVDHAEAVEEAAVPLPFDAIAGTREGACRGVIAIAVDDQDAGLLERRNKEDRGVRFVMADVDDLGQADARNWRFKLYRSQKFKSTMPLSWVV